MIITDDSWKQVSNLLFEYINSIIDRWDLMSDVEKDCIFNWYYQSIFKCKNNTTGLVSNNVLIGSGRPTDDHFISPRSGIRAIMKNNRELLDDRQEFQNVFELLRSTVQITSKQNNEMKYKNVGGQIEISELTINKYDDILWYDKNIDDFHDIEKGFPLKHTIPDWLTDYEKQFLI